jgi:putative DNA primase/helicase
VTPEGPEVGDGFFADAILAETLARELAGKWVWTAAAGWHRWTGQVWREVGDPAAVEAVRSWIVKRFRACARKADPSAADLAALDNWRKVLSRGRIEAVLSLCRGLCEVDLARFDADPMLLNTPAGVLDLATGALRPHDPALAMTKLARHSPGTQGQQAWEAFLDRVLPDPAVRGYVRRVLGHSLLGEVRDHVLPMLHGDGRNGKGTLRDAVLWAVGDYGKEVDPGLVMRRGADRHLTFMMELRGLRVVFTSETQRDLALDEPVAKRLCGGDPIQANRMRRDPVTFYPSHTLLLMTNHLPTISGDDAAMARRVKVVPFEVAIPEGQEDVTLSSTLRKAGPAVMAWLLEGLADYLASGLAEPEQVRLRSARYVADSDPLGCFLAERTEPAAGVVTPARPLYMAYAAYVAAGGHRRPVSETAFASALKTRGHEKKAMTKGAVWMDLALKPEHGCLCPNGAHGVHRENCS